MLLYQTTDRDFLETALAALDDARIRCYSTGGETPYGRLHTYCIFLVDDADASKANAILLVLGAAAETPILVPTSWQFRAAAGVFLVLLMAAIVWVFKTWPGLAR